MYYSESHLFTSSLIHHSCNAMQCSEGACDLFPPCDGTELPGPLMIGGTELEMCIGTKIA